MRRKVIADGILVGGMGVAGQIRLFVSGTITILVFFSGYVFPQQNIHTRPGDNRPELPSFIPSVKKQGNILPKISLPKSNDSEGLIAGQRILVREILITGNSVISEKELRHVAIHYIDRELSVVDINELRDRLTQIYISKGYISSGAIIPKQEIKNATLDIRIIEGRLLRLNYQTTGKLSEDYIRGYIDYQTQKILNIYALENQLQYLKDDKHINQVHAVLVPGKVIGESILKLTIIENKEFSGSIQFDNYQSPAVGSDGARVIVTDNNLAGYGDELQMNASKTKALLSYGGHYEWPLQSRDSNITLNYHKNDIDIIEGNLDELDFKSSGTSYGLKYTQTIQRKRNSRVDLSLKVEHRTSQSIVFDNLQLEGGNSVSVLRFSQNWTRRSQQFALTAISTLNTGNGGIKGAEASKDNRVGRFVTWLGQFQWAYRFLSSNNQLTIRTDIQLSDSSLLGMEQFSVGGHASVRGYRENTFVRDNGWVASISYRAPLYNHNVNLSLFVDAGRSWNKDPSIAANDARTIYSVGLGVHGNLTDSILLKIDWAKSQRNLKSNHLNNLQDDGVHVSILAKY